MEDREQVLLAALNLEPPSSIPVSSAGAQYTIEALERQFLVEDSLSNKKEFGSDSLDSLQSEWTIEDEESTLQHEIEAFQQDFHVLPRDSVVTLQDLMLEPELLCVDQAISCESKATSALLTFSNLLSRPFFISTVKDDPDDLAELNLAHFTASEQAIHNIARQHLVSLFDEVYIPAVSRLQAMNKQHALANPSGLLLGVSSVNSALNQQRLVVLARLTAGISRLRENCDILSRRKRALPPRVTQKLLTWFDQTEGGYPSIEQKELIAMDTGLTVGQVGTWFGNYRNRKKRPQDCDSLDSA